MKRILYIFVGLVLLCSCAGRSNSPVWKTQKDAEEEFVSTLTAADTAAVLELTDKFMSLVKDDKVEDAVGMVTVLFEGVLYKPSDDYFVELVNLYRSMRIASYTLDKYFFTTEGNNDVSYMTESKTIVGDSPMKLRVVFNPVKVDDSWYLALKDGTQSSKLLPKDKQIHDMAPAPESIRLNTRPSEQ